jgi:GNAT superfamily N-acetyltransferase
MSDMTPIESRGANGKRTVSEIAAIKPGPDAEWEMPSWEIRAAAHADVPAVAAGVSELLVELGGTPAPATALEETARALIDDPDAGVVLVAEGDGLIVGVLCVSWQVALRIPGRYGLIQELWVDPDWRGRTIGGDLLVALFELARRRQVATLEVGLPSERFPHLGATEAFYTNNGFSAIGMRMRRRMP